ERRRRPRACARCAASRACVRGRLRATQSAIRAYRSLEPSLLQVLILLRSGKAPAQLIGVARRGGGVSKLALDPHRQPERLRRRLGELVVASDEDARRVELAAPVLELREVDQRRVVVRVELERALEVFVGVL